MPPKRMSYKLRLHAASQKSPCTSSKCSRPKSDHISFLPDSPDSLDSKEQPKSNSYHCSDRLDNHRDSLSDQKQLNEDYFNVCEVALDSPRSLTFTQEHDGKSDQDYLKEFNLSQCSIVLCRYDSFSEESTKKSDEDLLLENGICQSYVSLERLQKSVVNNWTHGLPPHKPFKVHYSSNYVSELDTMDCEYFLQRKKEELPASYEEFYRKLDSTFRSLKFEQVAHKTVMDYKNQLDLRHRISELIKKRESALKQKKRIYYEKNSYVLLNKEDISKVKPCKVDLGLDCSLVSSSSLYRTCDSTSKEESIRKERHKIYYKNNFYILVPEEANGNICREAVEREKQCKVVPNLRCCSLSPDSMRKLFESINEGKKETLNNRRTSCEEDSENISSSPDSMSRISGSNYNGKSLYRRTSSNSPVPMYNISGSINNGISPHRRKISISSGFMAKARQLITRKETMQKRKIVYPDDHYVMVNHDDVNKIRTAVEVVLNKPMQKRIKAVHNSDANLIEEAIKNEQNCRVVLEDINLSLPQKFIIKKGVKNGQKKRKDIENRTVLENLEYVPLSLNKNSISRVRESTCEKADFGQKRMKSSGNEYCVLLNRQCYSKLRMAVQNMEHCNVALDSNIRFFRSKETVLPPFSVAVPPSTHRDISSFTNTHENCPDLVSRQLSNSDRNKLFSNTEHNSQNFVLDQDSLSSSSCNFSSDFRTTFSGGLSDHGSLESIHEDSPQDVNAIDPNSLPLTLNTPLLSSAPSTYPQSINESMSPEGHRTYPSSTNEFSSSSQTCVTKELLVNQNSEKSIVAQYSLSQETCALSQNIQSLMPTGVQCSPLPTNEKCSQELFELNCSQNSPIQHSISRSPKPCVLIQDSALSTSENYSQERFGNLNSPTPCSILGSLEPCDSTQSSVESSESDHLTPAHVTKQDSPNACRPSASPNPYSLTHNSPALIVSGALTSCVTRPESPNACNSSASPNPNSLTLTTSGALTSAHVTIQDSPNACITSASPYPYSLTHNSPALIVSGALTSCVTRPESPNACNSSASPNPNSLTLTTSGALTSAHVTIQDSPNACSTSASPYPYSLTQTSPALTVSGTSCVTRPESPNACNSSASPNPNSLTLISGALTSAHVTIQDSPDACSTSASPNPYSLTQNSPALTVSGALTSCVTRPENPNACNSSASPNPKFFDSPNASSTSTAMDTDTEVDDEQMDSNVGRFKMDIAHEALDFSALNGNGEAQENPDVTEHEHLVKVRTNGVVKDLDSSTEEMDYSIEEEDCPLQFDGKAGIKIVTNGLWNGGISCIDSDHSSSSTVITNKRTDDLGGWYMPTFTNNDR